MIERPPCLKLKKVRMAAVSFLQGINRMMISQPPHQGELPGELDHVVPWGNK